MEKEEKRLNTKFIIMAIICICLFVIAIVPKSLQNDTFYTIKLGKLILDNGIDMKEHFAWHEGLPYTYPHWLYDVGLYLVYNVGGFNGIYISSIVLGIILGVTIYLTNAKLSKNSVITFFTTILILYIGKDFITARAQLITFTLFVLEIYFIEKFLQTKKKRYAIGLLIIPTIIANVHAAVFPFYFVLYMPYIAEWLLSFFTSNYDVITKILLKSDELEIKKLLKKEKLSDKEKSKLETYKTRVEKNKEKLENQTPREPYKIIVEKNHNTLWLIVIMALAVLTGLLTPIGDTPYTYLIHTMQGNTTQNISEHLPIVLYNSKYVLGYMIISICLITFTKIKVKASDLFLLGGLMFLTIMTRRQMSLLFFVGTFVINKILAEIIEVQDKDGTREILKYFTHIIGKIIIYAIFVAFMVVSLKKANKVDIVSNKDYPVEATEYIKENLDVNNIKLFNEYNFGSYLLFEDVPVFIDSRADVYDPQFNKWDDDIFRDFINIVDLNTDYEKKFEHYGITHLLIYKKSLLSKMLSKDSENYKELYSDDNFIVFERLTANKEK